MGLDNEIFKIHNQNFCKECLIQNKNLTCVSWANKIVPVSFDKLVVLTNWQSQNTHIKVTRFDVLKMVQNSKDL